MKVTLKQIKEVLAQPISKCFEKGTNCTKERVYEIIRKNKGEPPIEVYYGDFHCPHCGEYLHAWYQYCVRCGQRIDWREIK